MVRTPLGVFENAVLSVVYATDYNWRSHTPINNRVFGGRKKERKEKMSPSKLRDLTF